LIAEELSQFPPIPDHTHQHIDPRNLASPPLQFDNSGYLSPVSNIARRNSPTASTIKQEVPLNSTVTSVPENGQQQLVSDAHLLVLKDSLQWPAEENLYMWSSPACDA
jgi:hypothetical protein